jgi:serine-type D-Ala-D-Ala carboxypeptidase/endopeptidase (penicillin-binding protein 4)
MNRILAIILAFAVFSPGSFFAQHPADTPLSLALTKMEQEGALKSGSFSMSAINLENGQAVVDHYAQRSMVPASIMKIVTTAVALEKLGPNFQFKTTISGVKNPETGLLNGNVYIQASGDPTLQSKYYSSIPSTIEKITEALSGSEQNTGILIVDASIYAKYNTPRGWIWEDMGNYFGATPSALMWRDNMLNVYLNSSQVGNPVMLSPKTKGIGDYTIDLNIESSSSNRDNAWFFSAPNSDIIYGQGSIPSNRANFLVKASHPDPMTGFSKEILRESSLKKMEARIEHNYIERLDLEEITTLISPPLFAIVKLCNMKSINLYAEALNIQLDKNPYGKTVEGGINSIESHLKEKHVDLRGVRIMDGSGLSPLNRMTAEAMTGILAMAYRSEVKEEFLGSLPVAGQSGTISGYFKGTKADGNVRAKSGTMTGVRNYAGYLTNRHGETVAFCIMLNDYDASRKTQVMQRIEEILVAIIEQ